MNDRIFEEFQKDVEQLIGQTCWAAVVGAGTGVIDLCIGRKIPSRLSIPNPHLDEDVRNYDAEMGVFIECSWRLDASAEVICAWTDDNSVTGPPGAEKIKGQTISNVVITRPGLDFELHFSNSLVLRVFCDRRNSDSRHKGNYTISLPNWTYEAQFGDIDRTPPED